MMLELQAVTNNELDQDQFLHEKLLVPMTHHPDICMDSSTTTEATTRIRQALGLDQQLFYIITGAVYLVHLSCKRKNFCGGGGSSCQQSSPPRVVVVELIMILHEEQCL
jgi:hypothetical protein